MSGQASDQANWWARPVPATTTDRSDEGHAEAAGSVESHIGSPTPSLVVLHPGAPQRHSQISPRAVELIVRQVRDRRDPDRVQEWSGELSKSDPVVVFCVYGFHVGCKTAIMLREAGFDAKYMKGGHSAWKAIGGAIKPIAEESQEVEG